MIGQVRRSMVGIAVGLGLSITALACGGAPPKSTTPAGSAEDQAAHQPPTRLDPIHFRAKRDQERLAIDAYDAAGLFERAAQRLREGAYDDAVVMYTRLVDEFPQSRFAAPALYNSGLCHEYRERFQDAASSYLKLLKEYPDSPDLVDAIFRLAGAYEKLEAWDAAAEAYAQLLTTHHDELEGIEQVEALARRGASLIALQKLDEAKFDLRKAVQMFREGRGVSPSDSPYFYAMAQFKLGEIVHAKMRDVELPADETAVKPALEQKCRLLLEAQREYTNAIKVAHAHFAAAAAFRIGALYRDLWDDMIAAPPPPDLNEEERQIYTEILKKNIRNLLKKATVQWERTMKMARRLNLSGEWVEQTMTELSEIREILASEDAPSQADRELSPPDAAKGDPPAGTAP